MDRAAVFLVGLPLFLFCTDIIQLFSPLPRSSPPHEQPSLYDYRSSEVIQRPLEFPAKQKSSDVGGIGLGSTVNINFCTSCSYRGTAATMKNMLETSFPGLTVYLANHPPALPKLIMSKVVPVMQVGIIGSILAGEQVFQRLGIATPPWFHSLRANRFGSLATTWLLGNFAHSYLQSTGAFEVYCNDELVFSKLREERFPGEFELRDIVSRKLSTSKIVGGSMNPWE